MTLEPHPLPRDKEPGVLEGCEAEFNLSQLRIRGVTAQPSSSPPSTWKPAKFTISTFIASFTISMRKHCLTGEKERDKKETRYS